MAPAPWRRDTPKRHDWDGSWKHDLPIDGYVLESWSQGFLVGALVAMAAVTIANMSKPLLHKLILVELILAMFHGTFCFMNFEGYGWYLSSTAMLLYASLYLHNIIAWMKTKAFLSPRNSRIYIFSFLLTTPYWILETYDNFTFFNNINRLFLRTRPFEALFRDPWWIFTALNLLYNIKQKYRFQFISLIRTSPRFGVMLVSMSISIVFIIVDVLYAIVGFGSVVGINPYWKFSLVFKCLCDIIILDDFRSALEKIRSTALRQASEDSAAPKSTKGSPRRHQPGRTSFKSLGNHVSIKSVAKNPKSESELDTAKLQPFGEKHPPVSIESEESDRIYITTDVVMENEKAL